jgi:hypothetical protein
MAAFTWDVGGGAMTAPMRMSQSRLEKLKETHEVIMHLGAVVVRHQFAGAECEAAVKMLNWLDAYRLKVEEKLTALGWTPGKGDDGKA